MPRTGGAPAERGLSWLVIVVPTFAGLAALAVGARIRRGRLRNAGPRGVPATLLFVACILTALSMTTTGAVFAAGPQIHGSIHGESRPITGPSVLHNPGVANPVTSLAPLVPAGLDLHAPPLEIPLRLHIPSLNVSAPMLGVGITPTGVMDAPTGSPASDVWQTAFWYRGSGIPGDAGTATIAGHASGGRAGSVFAHLGDIRRGDTIVVHDARSDREIHFTVTASRVYSLEELTRPSILSAIYGPGPTGGRGALASDDGVSRLTLITCAGQRTGSDYDHRLVVYAERVVTAGE